MAAPQTPLDVDGVLLSVVQRQWLDKMIAVIYAPDPTRPTASILDQALRCFRKVHQQVGDGWIKRSVVQLGNSETDAILVLGTTAEA